MKKWVLYVPETGEIRRSGSCTDESFDAQAQEGLLLLEADGSGRTHYVLSGEVIAYSDEQVIDKANTFFPEYRVWRNTPPGWVGEESLEDIKLQARARIKAQRESRIAEPKVTSVGTFDSTPKAQGDFDKVFGIVNLLVLKGFPGVTNYTLANNERVELTLEQMQQAALEMAAQVQGLHDQAYAMRESINAAITKAEVDAVVWPT